MKSLCKQCQKDYVLVPQSDIDAIEQARVRLWELLPEANPLLVEVTEPMWKITHNKYEKIKK